MKVRFEGNGGTLDVDGKNYNLMQLHWHTPSEHRLNGIQYVHSPSLFYLINRVKRKNENGSLEMGPCNLFSQQTNIIMS